MTALELRELGFSDGLVWHLANFEPSSFLGFRCQPPLYWLSSPISERPIIALWECGTILVYFNKKDGLFEKCSLEVIEDVWVKFRSAQAMLADLFIELYEDELTDAQLTEAAQQVGFLHVGRLLSEVQVQNRSSYEAWAKHFPHTCEG